MIKGILRIILCMFFSCSYAQNNEKECLDISILKPFEQQSEEGKNYIQRYLNQSEGNTKIEMLFHPDHILHFKKNCNFPNYYKRIRFCLEVLKLKKESRLVINTNADRSEYKKNPKISLERGEIVKEIFVFYGIEPERISIVDNADKHPLGDNQTAEGQRMNRRVELRIPNYL